MMVPLYTRAAPTFWLVVAAMGCSGLTQGAVPGGVTPSTEAAGDSRGDPGTERSGGAGNQGLSADVLFIQNMIPHHAQALEVSALAPGRAEDRQVEVLARRIEAAQRDEIARMARWLDLRGVPHPLDVQGLTGELSDSVGHLGGHTPGHDAAPPADHTGHGDLPDTGQDQHGGASGGIGAGTMQGMLTPEEMQELEALSGNAFDRRFLELMIRHHQGAVVMVAELFASPGAAQNPEIFELASEIDGGQRVEIDRMRQMLATIR